MTKPAFIFTLLAIAFSTTLPSTAYAEGIDFGADIWPIFEERCITCHGPKKDKGDLRYDDLDWLADEELIGGGNVEDSLIYELITLSEDHDDVMPSKGGKLTHSQIVLIRLWLESGGKAEGWVVPEIDMEKIENASKSSASDKETPKESSVIVLAKNVQAASDDAVEALQDKGALAIPLAQDNNLLRVDFSLVGDKVTDADLPLLNAVCKHVTWLSLANTKVTDGGLKTVAGLPKLTRLHLDNTQIGDAGLTHLVNLEHLEYLNLFNTKVTDEGLKQLASLKNLQKVFLWQSKATPEGAKALEAAIPGLQVNTGIELVVKKPEADLSKLFTKDSCCAKAHSDDKACEHPCCVEAGKDNKVCTKCNKPTEKPVAKVVAPSLTLNKSSYAPGEKIIATFAGGPDNSTDWIGIVAAGFKPGPNDDTGILCWYYIDGSQDGLGAKDAGTVTLDGSSTNEGDEWPLAPGKYDVYFVCCDGYDPLVTPVTITVTAEKPVAKKLPTNPFTKDSCCDKAHAAGATCKHGCCVEATKDNKVCTKCNKPVEKPAPKVDLTKLFAKDSCCAKAHAAGKTCEHPCCVEAGKDNKVCTKCNKPVEKPTEKPVEAKVDIKTPFAEDSCCANAQAAGATCNHGCCRDAAKENKVCTKCNKP